MQVAASIFKAYDIRGIVPSTLNEQVAEALGRAFGAAALAEGQASVAVGRDGRLSGPALSAALVRGLVTSGVHVIDIGVCTTPMLYFAASTLCHSGIQITGSHNPKDYNGFKMVLAGRAIYGDEIQALRRTMEAEAWSLQSGGSVAQALDFVAINGAAAQHHLETVVVLGVVAARDLDATLACGAGLSLIHI